VGNIVSNGGYSEKDMRSRIDMAKQAFMNKKTSTNWKVGHKVKVQCEKLLFVMLRHGQ